MTPFAYYRAQDAADALASAGPHTAFLAGGTDLLPLHRIGIAVPEKVIDISRLAHQGVDVSAAGIVIGAASRMRDVASNPVILAQFPVISQSLLASASPQIRNVATLGGNLLQRTRCAYFRSSDLSCNKRTPGSGCGARDGYNRAHALFGTSPHCVATHPSDLAVALVALDARVELRSVGGDRKVALEDFYRLPEHQPDRDTIIDPRELLIAIEVPAWDGPSSYVKVRDRASFEFAVVSVAAALRIEAGKVRAARLCAGGVGTRPWRLRDCEAALQGQPAGDVSFRMAARHAGGGAAVLGHNDFKIDLLEVTVVRALHNAFGAV